MSTEFGSVDVDSLTKTYQSNRITGSEYKKILGESDIIWSLYVSGTLFDSQYVKLKTTGYPNQSVELKITGYPKKDSDGKIVGLNVVGCDVISHTISF